MLNAILVSALLLFGFQNIANAGFVDIPPQQLQNYLNSNAKVVVLFDSGDSTCTACEPEDGGPFKTLSTRYGSSIKFIRVRWSPWWKFPPEVKPIFKQAKFDAIPSVFGFENDHLVFWELGRLNNTNAIQQKIASTMGSSSPGQK